MYMWIKEMEKILQDYRSRGKAWPDSQIFWWSSYLVHVAWNKNHIASATEAVLVELMIFSFVVFVFTLTISRFERRRPSVISLKFKTGASLSNIDKLTQSL